VNNVQVSASLSAATSSVVYVMGEVQNQGKLPLSGRVNLWRLVANAGGFTANADRRHVTVLRMAADGSEVRTVYDFEAWRAGQTVNKGDVLIQPGDMVYVPVQTQRYVYVTGEVETPRQILLDSDVTMTASQALTMGGGAMLRGDDGRVLLLRKTAANEPLVTELDIKALFEAETYLNGPSPADPVLAAGDILYVPTSAVGDLNKFAARWFRDGFWTILPFSANASYQRGDFNTKSDPN
jgi:polysaccharide export outer membrane protein